MIHLAAKRLEKKAGVVIEGEKLDVLIGDRPLAGEGKGRRTGKYFEAFEGKIRY